MSDLEANLEETRNAIAPKIGTGQGRRLYSPLSPGSIRTSSALPWLTSKAMSPASATRRTPFSIQSISKVFTLTLVLCDHGADLWKRVGREPSGSPFNSIVQLGKTRRESRAIPSSTPAPSLSATCCLATARRRTRCSASPVFFRNWAQDPLIGVDPEVAASERETGFRNAALANFMRSFGNLDHPVDEVLEVYFSQCAVAMNCVQLARSALFLAAGGKDPVTSKRIVSEERARRISALMLSCGHYDASGDFAFRVGLPGKSGVGGGILAVVPNRCAIAVWSPGLNENGNSLAGTLALEHLAAKSGWSVFLG